MCPVSLNSVSGVPQSGSLQGRVTFSAGTFPVLSGITHMSHTYVSVSLVPENDLAMDYCDSAFNRILPNVLHVVGPLSPHTDSMCLIQILTSGFHGSANIKEKTNEAFNVSEYCLDWQ